MVGARCRIAAGVGLWLGMVGCVAVSRTDPGGSALRDREAAERLNQEGLAHLEAGEFARAETSFAQAVRRDPFLGSAYNNRAVSLVRLGRYFDAAHAFEHASRLMPQSAGPRRNLGILLERSSRFAPAEEHLRAALAQDPEDIQVIGHLARLHVRQNKFTSETRSWLELVAARENDPAWRDWAAREITLHQGTSEERRSP